MKTIVAGVITGLHDVIRDKIHEISKGEDAEAAGMAELWFDRIEETDFEDVNFNRDVFEKMQSKKAIPASMTYFTFRNHFLSKVLNPIRDAIREYLVQKDSELKHDQSELNWLNGFLDKYVALASYDRVKAALRHELANRMRVFAAEKRVAARLLCGSTEKELLDYCRETIPDFGELEREALDAIDHNRDSLQHSSPELYNAMLDVIEEYCDENGLDPDDFDVEDVFWAE